MRLVLLSLLTFFLTGLLLAGFLFWSYSVTPAPGSGVVEVVIPKGAGVRRIGTILADKGLISSGDFRFAILARLNGVSSRLRAGEYSIPKNLSPVQVLRLLEKGEVVQHPVTIPEGLTISQIAAVFAQGGWVQPEEFIRLANDREVARSLGVEQDNLEGYLFPDTYFFTRGTIDERALLAMMTARFFKILEDLPMEKLQAMSVHQMVTLASMVEKETGSAPERPLIAGVFFNRLARKMRLQSDPTVIYGIKNFNGNLTRADLRRPSPYNTYVIPGLPRGPICNPGREALLAVLVPERTDALYFVSRNDGTHVFSNTLRQHNSAVRKYQKNYKARK